MRPLITADLELDETAAQCVSTPVRTDKWLGRGADIESEPLVRPRTWPVRSTPAGKQASSQDPNNDDSETADVGMRFLALLPECDDVEFQRLRGLKPSDRPSDRRKYVTRGKQRVTETDGGVDAILSVLLMKAEECRSVANILRTARSSSAKPSRCSSARELTQWRGTTGPETEMGSGSNDPVSRMWDAMHESYERVEKEAKHPDLLRNLDSETGTALTRATRRLKLWRFDIHAREVNTFLAKHVKEVSARHRKYVQLVEMPSKALVDEAKSLLLIWDVPGTSHRAVELGTSLAKLNSLQPTDESYASAEVELRNAVTALAMEDTGEIPGATPDLGSGSIRPGPAIKSLRAVHLGPLSSRRRFPEDPLESQQHSISWRTALGRLSPYE